MSRLFDLLIARPKSSLLVVLLLTLVTGAGALRLQVDFSPEQVYVGQDNAVEFCEQHKELFRFEDSIILVVLESQDDQTLLRPECLSWLKKFAEEATRMEGVRSVTSVVTLERPRVRIGSDSPVTWSPWLSEDYYDDEDYVARRLSQLPLMNDTLVSQDRRLMLTLVDLNPEDRTIAQATQRVEAIQQLIESTPLPQATRTFISGVPAIRVDVIRSILNDQMRMVPVCSALFFVVSLLMFRSLKVTLLSLFSALTTVALTTGLMGWAGLTFSVMSNVVPALLLIIAAANNVHIVSRFQVELRARGSDDYVSCAKATMIEMSHTCALTLATSGIGFGSLLIARAELLQSLAVQAAGGMACCYVALMIILPQTLVICGPDLSRRRVRADRRTESAEGANHASRLDSMWRTFGAVIADWSIPIVALHLLAAAWTIWACRDIAINSYMFETYDGDHPTMDAVRKLDNQMSGLISLEVQLQAEDRQRLFDRDLAEAIERIRRTVPQDKRITFYRDYVEFLSAFDHGRTINGDATQLEASLKRIQLVLRQIDSPELTRAFLAEKRPAARIMIRIRDVGSAGMQELITYVSDILQRELPQDIRFVVTGDAYLHAVCMDAFVRDLFYSLIAASGVIFLLITVLFQSLRVGIISAVPNMFPLVMTLGYMHLRGYELTAGNVIVFAISLGIAVDDTIHFLARYRDERKSADPPEAIQNALHSSGRAIVLTSVLVVSGLSILIFSDFVPTRRFAELTAVTMCSALPGDVILLPAMLKLFGQNR